MRRELDPEWWWWTPEASYAASQLEVAGAHLAAYLSAHGVKGVQPLKVQRPGQTPDETSPVDEVQTFFRR